LDHREADHRMREPEYVAARYRVVQELGRGGMAAVYRVFDESSKKELALKLLSKNASESPHLSALFEREFHTLAQLAHPQIIEVYDFGVDVRGAYYTMELLDGHDLRRLAPLDWKDACRLLRDVASSLALLHSRRLLHRDVSSRNVRCTKDGRAKLIDFGAMTPFGVAAKVIGTPAFIAPEAINHQPLDQRTDLYALGSLAYWLITKRYAYRAHHLKNLQDAWRSQPLPLSALAPSVPKALNDLVMSLLSLDRMARPFSASEVVETLSACAGLPSDNTLEVKHSYLTTPQLVGRKSLVIELHKKTLAMIAGHGGATFLFEGPSGIGRSRLLAELVLEGKLAGASVLTAAASARTPYGVVWELIEQLFTILHELAADAFRPYLEVLIGAFPGLPKLMMARAQTRLEETFGFETISSEFISASLELTVRDQEPPRELPQPGAADAAAEGGHGRASVQKALLNVFTTVIRERRFVIAVDDIHRADEPSVALLSTLALESNEALFILAVTGESGATPTAPAAYALLSRLSYKIDLGPLDQDATEKLLVSIFGDAPKLGLVADRIFAISGGNPRSVMQLAQHLVDKGTIRYRSGAWVLPSSVDQIDLPASITEALRAEIRSFSPDARNLAQTIALSADQRFSFEECLLISGHGNGARLTQALNELIGHNVLTGDGAYYTLTQAGWVGPLITELDADSELSAHLRLADLFAKRGGEMVRETGHLLKARQVERALDTFLRLNDEIRAEFAHDPDVLSQFIQSLPINCVEMMEELLTVCQVLDRPRRHRYMVLSLLNSLGAVEGTVRREHAIEVIDLVYQESGLAIYQQLDTIADDSERLRRALEMTQARYDATPERDRVFPPAEAIREFVVIILNTISIASNYWDYSLLEYVPSVRPFIPLSPLMAIVETNVGCTLQLVGGDSEQALQGFRVVMKRLSEPDRGGIDEAYYEYSRLSVNHAVAAIEASLGIDSALTSAADLEAAPLFQANAWQIRMIYYLRQADAQKAEQCRKFFEMVQIQNDPAQFFRKANYYSELLAYCFSDDRAKIRETLDGIEKMAEKFPGWVPIYHFGKSEYLRIAGDYAAALEEVEKALALTAPGRHAIWPYASASRLRCLLELGRVQEAQTIGHDYLRTAEEYGCSYLLHQLALPVALIEARLGHEDRAVALAETAISEWKSLGVTGITMGLAFETRARIAIYADDPKTFRKYAKLCGEQYRTGYSPTLTARYQKLIQDAHTAYAGIPLEVKQASELVQSLNQKGDLLTSIREYLAPCQTYQRLLDRALELMIKRTGSKGGFLYLFEGSELKLVTKTTTGDPPDHIYQAIQDAFTSFEEEISQSEISATKSDSLVSRNLISNYHPFEWLVLSAIVEGRSVSVGAVVFQDIPGNVGRPPREFYQAIALCVYDGSRKELAVEEVEALSAPGSSTKARYQLVSILGEGGMGSVYKVRERESGLVVALKRVRANQRAPFIQPQPSQQSDELKKRLEERLRREYQILKSLAHPRITEVYDFGVDREGAYYTMELLEGADLRQLAPVPWKQACVFLKDIASALALLHSRRLIHRDLTPQNVRLTADGHVKLMDFGAMAVMGIPMENLGTAPFVPPEAIYSRTLDQRADLYGLGALAYFLLTGRNAYPVRRTAELAQTWLSRPRAPSELKPSTQSERAIPEDLDRLVLSLIDVDPLARPTSAQEVMERLSAVAGLPSEEQLDVPRSYLTMPTLVGRDRVLITMRKRVIRALRRRGGAVLITGESGVGRSRFLDVCVMEAKLAGMTVLRASARSDRRLPYAAVRGVFRQLLEELPELARDAASSLLPIVAPIVPELWHDPGTEQRSTSTSRGCRKSEVTQTVDATDNRAQVQTALRDWILKVCHHRALMIAVDDLHQIDEPSAAVFALLSQEISDKTMLLVGTVTSSHLSTTSAPLDLMRKASSAIELKRLSHDQTKTLLLSIFGDVSNLALLADRLYIVSDGAPGTIIQMAQYLLDRDLIRYRAGGWTLPSALKPDELPSSLIATYQHRLQNLDSQTVQLAQVMALSPDQRFYFEECQTLAPVPDPPAVLRQLGELVAAGVVVTDGDCYSVSQYDCVRALTESIRAGAEPGFHLQLAAVFRARRSDRFRATRHLLCANQKGEALDLFIEEVDSVRHQIDQSAAVFTSYLDALPEDWRDTYMNALAACQQLGRPPKHTFLLQRTLLSLGQVTGVVTKEVIRQVIQQLYRDSGLSIYDDSDESSDRSERLIKALEIAQKRYEEMPQAERVMSPAEAISELGRALFDTVSIAATSFDLSLLSSLPSTQPLVSFSPAFGVIAQLIQATIDLTSARHERALRLFKEAQAALDKPGHAGFEEMRHRYALFGVLNARGLIEACMGLTSCITNADRIENDRLHQVNAWRIRYINYLRQGDVQKAEQCKKLVERLRIQNVPSQFFEGTQLFAELSAYSLMDDLTGVSSVMEGIDTMARYFQPWVAIGEHARGEYHRIRGDYLEALAEFERFIPSISAGHHIIWPYAAAAHLRTALALKRYAQAQVIGRTYLQAAERVEIDYNIAYIKMPLAMIEAELGKYQEAILFADSVIDYWTSLGSTGINLGLAYETRAVVAVSMRDQRSFDACAAKCGAQYLPGHTPALVAKYQLLIRQAQNAGLDISKHPNTARFEKHHRPEIADPVSLICDQIERLSLPEQRALLALEILIDHCGAKCGYLFGLRADALALISSKDSGQLPARLFERAALYVEEELADSEVVTVPAAAYHSGDYHAKAILTEHGCTYEPVLLQAVIANREVIVGLAVLSASEGQLRVTASPVISAIGEALLAAGDVVAKAAAS
jgi:serine/threonine protein kinase/predicted ATPase